MKLRLFLILAIVGISYSAKAQDALTKADGPQYSISTQELIRIDFENGEFEIFDHCPQDPMDYSLKYRDLRKAHRQQMQPRLVRNSQRVHPWPWSGNM